MSVHPQIETDWDIEYEFHGVDGGWSRVTRDVLLRAGIKAGWGGRGNWPTSPMADVGTLLHSLNNSEANEARRLGLYTLGGAVCREGFDYGIRVRYLLDGVPMFVGRLDAAPPSPGIHGDRDVRCRVSDYMDELGKWPVRGIPTQTGLRADQVVAAILDAMPIQPSARALDEGGEEYAWSFDQAAPRAGEEIGSATQSEMGRFYVLADTATLENRARRRNRTPEFAIDGTYVDFDPGNSYQRENVKTRVEVITHPREVDDEESILYSLQDKLFIGPGQTRTVVARYVDPDQRAAAIGGANMTDPITDFTANTRADGAGTDMAASLDITATFGGREATLIFENAHATLPLYVTSTNLWGIAVRDLEQATASSVADSDDLERYGENTISIDMKYQGSANFGQAVANGVRAFMGTPRLWEGKFRFCANASAEMMNLAKSANVSTCFRYSDEMLGESDWFINALDHEIDSNNLLWVTWYCEPADLTHYWMPGVDVLGETTLPAPF